MSFPFNQLPAELRLEIWIFAVRAGGKRQRRVIEQNLQVFPTLSLAASPLFSVNSESREVARSFYTVRLEVYRRDPRNELTSSSEEEEEAEEEAAELSPPPPPDSQDCRGLVYLSPVWDVMVSVYRRAAFHESELSLEHSERSKMTAWFHRAGPMSKETLRLFHRQPDRWCLTRYASAHLSVQDWIEVREWILAFEHEQYRGARRLLQSMHINTAAFGQVFGYD
ncbi:hypothetical protein SAMD00023353_1601350 [Rosellinia necatrix]|uniref:2EXR domain-containing protein n=1 Tax=Rosellinia necatrix TaxID=77044 RepID=A0A1W2TI88_ROSNE|nr:hypothetical protein SAMD00023353_1601350 [Rosellinia necatrix]